MNFPIPAKLAAAWRQHPRRTAVVAATLIGLAVLALVTVFWGLREWDAYHLDGTLLTLDLPAIPEAVPRAPVGDTRVVYQARCRDLAVIAAGGPVPSGTVPDPVSMVGQALAYFQTHGEVSDLRCQTGQETINDAPCIIVSGTFLRDGVPARLTGAFFTGRTSHSHVICFWSAPEGARRATRVLRSIRVAQR